MEFIIFFAVAMIVIGSLHAFVMRSVSSYDGYGVRDNHRDWREFQSTKTGLYQ
jgi:hypothetical protein